MDPEALAKANTELMEAAKGRDHASAAEVCILDAEAAAAGGGSISSGSNPSGSPGSPIRKKRSKGSSKLRKAAVLGDHVASVPMRRGAAPISVAMAATRPGLAAGTRRPRDGGLG